MEEIQRLFVRIGADVSEALAGFNEVKSQTSALERNLKSTGDSLTSAGRTLTAGVTVPLVALGAAAFKASVDFESAFAGVRKTVDATEEEFAVLRKGIRDMAKEMPASASQIAQVVEAAGQLGIHNENILEFSKVMIMLGESTNLAATDAAMALARFANITQMSQKDFDRLGATIVHLGNNLATTEREIVEMAMRIAGAGKTIGLTEAQIMSFAGALSSVGVEAQMGGTAISRVMVEIASSVATADEKLALLASTAGMSASQFQKAWQEDAAGALVAFIEGLGKVQEEGGNLFALLDELGFGEVRVRDALLRMAGAGDLVRQSLELGNQAWEENIALNEEFSRRLETTAAKLKMIFNRLWDVAITLGDVLVPRLMSAFNAAKPLITVLELAVAAFAALPEPIQTAIIAFIALQALWGPLLWALGMLTTGIAALIPLLPALGAAFALLTGPIGLVVLAIGLLVAAFATDFLGVRGLVVDAVGSLINAFLELKHLFELGLGGGTIGGEWGALQRAAYDLGKVFREDLIPVINDVRDAWQLFRLGIQGGAIGGEWSALEEQAFQLGASIRQAVQDISAAWESLKPVFALVGDDIKTRLEGVVLIIKANFDLIVNLLHLWKAVFAGDWARAWDEVKQILGNYLDLIVGLFKAQLGSLSGVISGLAGDAAAAAWEFGKGIGDGIYNAVKEGVNYAIEAINRLITAWNGLEFKAGGGSVLGVGLPSVNFGTPDLPTIPTLDSGGIVTRPTLAALAMNSRPEAVIPLDQLRDTAIPGFRIDDYMGGGDRGGGNYRDPSSADNNGWGNPGEGGNVYVEIDKVIAVDEAGARKTGSGIGWAIEARLEGVAP